MAHNKLYRNFIILQADEKALSGYAKIEAKGDKCKLSFYAQNLDKDQKYLMVLICYKKDLKQIVDLGQLPIKEGGKGEALKEYYVNNIAGLDMSYDKISGAAIAKHNDGNLDFIMYGFMNGEHVKDDWKKYKVIKYSECGEVKSKDENKIELKEPEELCHNEHHKEKEEIKHKEHHKEKEEVKHKEHHKEKLELVKEIKEEIEDKKELKEDIVDIHKDKMEIKEELIEKHKDKMEKKEKIKEEIEEKIEHIKHHKGKEEIKQDELEELKEYILEKPKGCKVYDNIGREEIDVVSSSEENGTIITDFDEYETRIERSKEINPYDFELRGGIGEYFDEVARGFDEIKNRFKDIKYCKWYRINVNTIEDLCNTSNYNRFTIAYNPMLNYYPYIKKYNHFMLGYKCDNRGDLKYLVYAIPGMKNIDEQPYMGKTGFVTWMKSADRSEDEDQIGYWLMFYDYKNSVVVVPMR